MTKELKNFRLNQFILFDNTSFTIAGMSGPHNHYHLSTDYESGSLYALKLLKEMNRTVYINLHEEKDFQEEAYQAGIEYYNIPVDDNASAPISVTIYDEIYFIVKKATEKNKGVTISCGAGDGRTGTALAALKLRELIEKEFAESLILQESSEATDIIEAYKGIFSDLITEVPCTPLVKKAIELIRTTCRITHPDSDNGIKSVETENDIRSLNHYEQYLRKRLVHEFKPFQSQSVASNVFGPYLFAGSNPVEKTKGLFSICKNLFELDKLGIDKIYSLEKKGNEALTTLGVRLGFSFQYLSEENQVSYWIEDFKRPSIQQMDQITTSMLKAMGNKETIYLHCQSGLGRTGTILAALYMKKTGAAAEEAIGFVRHHYDSHAIETKEQVEALIHYDCFLNYRSLDQKIKSRKLQLFIDIQTLPSNLRMDIKSILKKLDNKTLPKEFIYNALVETSLLIRSEIQTTNWAEKYQKLAQEICSYRSYQLFKSSEGSAARLSNHGLYKQGRRRQDLCVSMLDLVDVYFKAPIS